MSKLKRPTTDTPDSVQPAEAVDSDEERMVQALENHNVQAFEELFEKYSGRLYGFILHMVKNHALAEEIVQEVFMRVLSKGREFRWESKVSTWLYTIARNLSLDALRKAKHRNHPSLDAPSGKHSQRLLGEEINSNAPSPDAQAEDRQFREKLRRAVTKLPPGQAEVFILRQFHHRPFQEIAAITGVPINTVKSRMRYALSALRMELEAFSPGKGGQA